jgi:hypothetical protein
MLGDGALAFSEFAAKEPLPLARVHDAILEFLRGRDDAVLLDAQAVNAYVDEPRMTQDVDIQSTRAAALAEELRQRLAGLFHVAVRVRAVADGRGYRLFQLQESRNRHLADLRQVDRLPPARRIADVWIVEPADLVAEKVMAYERRKGRPKSFTDRRDVASLLLRFPELRAHPGPVGDRLQASGAGLAVLDAWKEIAAAEILPDEEEAD